MTQSEADAAYPAALERRLWLACAPPLTRVPEVGHLAYYFPRGHLHQCDGAAPTGQATDNGKVLCVVTSVDLLVRGDDEVYATIGLTPVDDTGLLLLDYARRALKGPVDVRHHALKDGADMREDASRALEDVFDERDQARRALMDGAAGHLLDYARRDLLKDGADMSDHARRALKNGAGHLLDYARRDLEDVVDEREHSRRALKGGAGHLLDYAPRDLLKDVADMSDHAPRALKDGAGHLLDYARRGLEDVFHDREQARRALKDGADMGDHARRALEDVFDERDRARRALKDGADMSEHARRALEDVFDERDHDRRDLDFVDACNHAGGALKDGVDMRDHARRALEDVLDEHDDALRHPKAPVDLVAQPEDVLLIFPKILTEGEVVKSRKGGFHLSKECATGIFPPLHEIAGQVGYPKQTLLMLDLGRRPFTFNHAHTGMPGGRRQHMFTSGWNHFLNTKDPKQGDILMFIRFGQELRIALQRIAMPAPFVGTNEVAEASLLAAEGTAFTVTWCPRRGAEFVVPREEVDEAWSTEWRPGMSVSCLTGVVRPRVVHHDLPHKITTKHGTIKAVQDFDWGKLDVDWEHERPSSSRTTSTATSMVPPSIRLFGVDIIP